MKEIELLNKLNHQNIVSFMGSVVHEGDHVVPSSHLLIIILIVGQLHPLLEYIDGGTLESLVKMYYNLNERSGEVKQFNLIAQDIANGMDYLHSNGLIHRDLTSKNVLLRKLQNQLFQSVISDFGFATHEPPDGSTVQLSTVGSPYWMAPECIRGDWYVVLINLTPK